MRYRALRLPGPEARGHHRTLRGTGDPTDVAALELDLHLPHCHSLKEKRAAIRPILEGAWRRYRVAAAEVGLQEKWQRALLGMACVSEDGGHAHEVLDKVERFVWSFPEIEVLNAEQTTFAWSD